MSVQERSTINPAFAKAALDFQPRDMKLGTEPLEFRLTSSKSAGTTNLEVIDSGLAYQWRRYTFSSDGKLLNRSAVSRVPPHNGTLDALDSHDAEPDPTDAQVMKDLKALSEVNAKI